MRSNLLLVAVLLIGTFQIALCGPTRVAHAVPDAPAVDVYVNGNIVWKNVSFTDITKYANLAAGIYQVQLNVAGTSTVVLTTSLSVDSLNPVTVAAVNTLATISVDVFHDDNREPSGAKNAAFKFVHLSPDAPAVNIQIGNTILFQNVGYLQETYYLEEPAGKYTLDVVVPGLGTVLTVPVTLQAGQVYTAWAEGLVSTSAPSETLQAVLSVDLD
mmetsp:Transcript_27461/g.38732  ORF Transcript_27461/g.38732 Transcript_27461/m.38732 type:complete len:215 (+) Transcript_27461:217-861(+)